ncbi:hypothetical protein ACVWXU_001234 [Streptomyces sp. TE33382]
MNDHFLNAADLMGRMERNLAEHACHLHRSMPGAAVTEADDLLVTDSGLDDDTFNIVAAARFTAATAPARITGTARTLARTGRRFSWWVGPCLDTAGPHRPPGCGRSVGVGTRNRHVGRAG